MVDLDRWEESTVVCALLHYALHIAEPTECIRVLDKVSPHPSGSWRESIEEARRDFQAIFDRQDTIKRQHIADLVGGA